MKTKKQLIKKVAKLHKKAAKLQAKIDSMPDVPVKTGVIYEEPEYKAEVWYTRSDVYVQAIKYSSDYHKEFLHGFLFHDEESAILDHKVRAIRHKLAAFCAMAWEDAGKVIDWGDARQSKYHLVYDYIDSIALLSSSVHTKKSAYFLPSYDLTELKESFTQDKLKLALTGEPL